MTPLKVLIACEESQAICIEFRKLGHEAYSCDLLPCSGGYPEWHIQNDAIKVLWSKKWDFVVAHPPCDRLANSGVQWLEARNLWEELYEACKFFNHFTLYGKLGNKIIIENPIQHKYARKLIGKYDQIIQPYQFGHTEKKSTCLWLYGVPELKETNNMYNEMIKLPYSERAKIHSCAPGPDRKKIRSKTYPGVAKAIATQYSEYLLNLKPDKTMSTVIQTTDKSFAVDVKEVEQLKEVVNLQKEKISKFLIFKLTDERVKDANQLTTEVKVIVKTINDQVEAICRPLKDKKKDIDALQKEVANFADTIMQPLIFSSTQLKEALLAFSQLNVLRNDRKLVLDRYKYTYEEDLAELSEEDFSEVVAYAKMIYKPEEQPAFTGTPVIKIEPPAIKVTGLRKDWKFKIVNPQLIPRQFLLPAEGLIREAIAGGAREIPGLEIYQEESIR